MNTIKLEKTQIEEIERLFDNDGIVAFPTDTVYGLGCRYDRTVAIEKLKASKGRPENKPLPMMVASVEQLKQVAVVSERDEKIINSFMPGALTMIFNKKEEIPDYVTNGFKTIGVRMPDDEFVLSLLKNSPVPLLVTSANLSGEPAGLNDKEVLAQLDGRIDAIVPGCSGAAAASTIIDVTGDEIKLIRQGIITLEQIKNVL